MSSLLDSLRKYRDLDWSYDSGRVFSSMCSKPLEEASKAYSIFLETNALDSRIFPSTEKLEDEAIEKIGGLFSNPQAGGYITSGGTEGNIFALWLARKLHGGNKVIAPVSAHYSVNKACDLQQVNLVRTRLDDDYRAEIESIKEEVDRRSLAIVISAGTTALGKVDPVLDVAEVAEDAGCFLHVDASFGGFVLPFTEDARSWDFEIGQVSSIAADPHKMGLTPIPSGALLVRERKWLDNLKTDIPYLSETKQTLLGTRTGASIASVWTALRSLGAQGYRKIIGKCMELTDRLAEGIRKIGGLELVTEPELNLVAFTSPSLNLHEIQEALEEKDWLVSLNQQPESIRLIVMPHHDGQDIDSFLFDLEKCAEELA